MYLIFALRRHFNELEHELLVRLSRAAGHRHCQERGLHQRLRAHPLPHPGGRHARGGTENPMNSSLTGLQDLGGSRDRAQSVLSTAAAPGRARPRVPPRLRAGRVLAGDRGGGDGPGADVDTFMSPLAFISGSPSTNVECFFVPQVHRVESLQV